MGARELYLAAVAKPGDTILIGFAHELYEEDIEALDRDFKPLTEQGIKVGFMDNVTSMVVVRDAAAVTSAEHGPGKAILCPGCATAGHTVCQEGVHDE
jgi:hypothetical protein